MSNIRYVDHIVLIADTEEKLDEILPTVVMESEKRRLNMY